MRERKAPQWYLNRLNRACEALGNKVICQRCGATVTEYADKCNAPLDVRCEGFETYDAAILEAGKHPGCHP